MQRCKQQKRQQEDQKPNEKPQKQTDKNASLLRKQKCPRQGLTTLAANGATDAACADCSICNGLAETNAMLKPSAENPKQITGLDSGRWSSL
jgi:hypothetical protein